MAKYNDRSAYVDKLFPIFLDSFLMTDSEDINKTKTVEFQKVYDLFLEALSETGIGFSQNNKFRFIYVSIVIGGPSIDLSNPSLYEAEIISKLNAYFTGFPLTVEDDELIIFRVQVVEYGTFYTHFRKYFFPDMLGKGTYAPLSAFIDAEQLEIAYIQNTTAISSPEIIEASPNNVIFDLGDITGQDFLTFVNTVSIPELPDGYNLTDTNKIYYFRFIDDGVTYLYYFDAENSLNGYGEYGVDGAYLFQVGELILMFDSTAEYPIISDPTKEDKVSGVIATGTNDYEASSASDLFSLVAELKILVTFTNPNTTVSTLNYNGLGAFPIVKNYDDDVLAGEIKGTMWLRFNGAKWVIVGSVAPPSIDFDSTPTSGSDNAVTSQGIKAYVDDKVAGLLDLRGSYDASTNTFPSSGGSGTAGAILKGDFWVISVAGVLGGTNVSVGDSLYALIDTPGSTPSNWSILETNLTYVPENTTNKATTMTGNETSNVLFLTAKAIYDFAVGLFKKKSIASTGSTIQFDTDRIYNSIASPTTGTMTNDLTGAQIGVVQKIYYNHSTTNPFPAGWVKLGSKAYTPSALNIIYAEWVGSSRVEYWISQES